VFVTGPPGSGKTTLSRELGPALSLPVLAKDTIKEALLRTLGADSVDASRRLGHAAVMALLDVAREARCGVLDSVWMDRSSAVTALAALPGPTVEVFCACDLEVMRRRHADRATSRDAGHFDLDRDASELWNPQSLQPLAGGWPVLTVQTTRAVDVGSLAAAVRRSFATASQRGR
jgi:predicted kinase